MAIPIVPLAIGGGILAGAILPKKSFDRLLLLGGVGVGGYLLLQRLPKAEDIPEIAEGFGYGITGGLAGLLEGMFKGMERLIPDIDLSDIVPDVTFPDLPDVKIDLPDITFPDVIFPDVTEGVEHIVEEAKEWIDEGERIIQALPVQGVADMWEFLPMDEVIDVGRDVWEFLPMDEVIDVGRDVWEFLPMDEVIDVGRDVWEWKIDRAQEAWDWVF